MFSEGKHFWSLFSRCRTEIDQRFLDFARNDMSVEILALERENPDRPFDPGFKCYPADAVQADHPFPFSHGWMTVTTASDFQSRPAMFCGRLSLLACINSGSGISPRNLEHRRVNVRSRKSEPIRDRLKSRQSRVERKALVSFPTLNKRLFFLKELFPQRYSQFAL